jgi:hypothetical protein
MVFAIRPRRARSREVRAARCAGWTPVIVRLRRATNLTIQRVGYQGTARASRPGHTVSDRRSDITGMTPASSDDGKNRDDARFQCLQVVACNDRRPAHTTPFVCRETGRAIATVISGPICFRSRASPRRARGGSSDLGPSAICSSNRAMQLHRPTLLRLRRGQIVSIERHRMRRRR